MDRQSGPRQEYARRLAERQAVAARAARLDRRMSQARLAAVAGAAAVAWLAWGRHILSPWWFAVPAAAFLALALVHGRVVASRLRAEQAAAFYDLGLARLDNRWAGRGDAGERFLNQAHLYAGDLDVFGRGSLFELLCTARTRAGEETLAAWLRAPASRGDVHARQDAVRDLLPRLDLREDLALLATEVRDGVHAGSLSAWATAEPVLRSRLIPITAALLAGASVLSLGPVVGRPGHSRRRRRLPRCRDRLRAAAPGQGPARRERGGRRERGIGGAVAHSHPPRARALLQSAPPRARRHARVRWRAAVDAHRPAPPAHRPARRAPQSALPAVLLPAAVGHPVRARHRVVARGGGAVRAALAGRGRGVRGPLRPGRLRVGEP